MLTSRPNDAVVLYNLGLALSDAGRLDRAEHCLGRAAAINPSDVNIQVALGVALGRMERIDEAVDVLQAAVAQDEKNPWAHRNLGALLIQAGKVPQAIPHYEAATQLLPEDQIAWKGLADAYRLSGQTKEAEQAYVTAVQIDPHSDVAEKARAGSNLLAESGFTQAQQEATGQEAVQYCLDAMKRFAPDYVTDPPKAGGSFARPSRVVSGRLHSSFSTVTSTSVVVPVALSCFSILTVIGTISSLK